MSSELTYDERQSISRQRRKQSRFVAVIALFFAVLLLPLYSYLYDLELGPKQPIPFSHRLHSGKKEISCLVCHTEATFSSSAGLPPQRTCMLCHSKIIVNYWPIRELHDYYNNNKPILWKQVAFIPDYAYFSHRVHVQHGIDCGHCHGDVRKMDRIKLAHNFKMDYCMTCHRQNGGPTGCYTCHR